MHSGRETAEGKGRVHHLLPGICASSLRVTAGVDCDPGGGGAVGCLPCVYAYGYVCMCDQSCLTLCDPMDCSPPGSSVHGDSPGKNTGVGYHGLLQGFYQPRD